MAKVSVLILAKNEEKFIGACIKSVKDFADEVIVIDDFSIDATAQISKKLGARVIQRGLNGDWGGQQTFARGPGGSGDFRKQVISLIDLVKRR